MEENLKAFIKWKWTFYELYYADLSYVFMDYLSTSKILQIFRITKLALGSKIKEFSLIKFSEFASYQRDVLHNPNIDYHNTPN